MPKPLVLATVAVFLAWSWVAMTFTHELGHIVGGLLGGGTLQDVSLRPWQLPHSYFSPNPHPLMTLWSGPLIGCLLPIIAAAIVRSHAFYFVASFCVLANASYLLLGYFSGDRELDSAKLIHAGTPPWLLLAFVVATLPLSYIAFRKQCEDLFSRDPDAIDKKRIGIAAGLLIVALAGQTLFARLLESIAA